MTALEQAVDIWNRSASFDRQARLDAAVALGEWGVFSANQIAAIVRAPAWERKAFAPLIGKTDRTGGRLNPESLPIIHEVSTLWHNGLVDVFKTKAAIDAGTTDYMIARLTGINRSQIRRQYERAVLMTAERKSDAAS